MCHVLIIEDEPLIAIAIQDIRASEGATSFEIVETEKAAVFAAIANKPRPDQLYASPLQNTQ